MGDAQRTFIFAGGGSGGHLYPGLAVVERIRESLPDARIVFLCSDRAIDRKILEAEGERFVASKAGPVSADPRRLVKLITGWRATGSQLEQILQEAGGAERAVVIAMGGFVAAPAAARARKLGVPVIAVNLDAVPGKANRLLVRWADAVLSATEQYAFPAELVGPIVRKKALPTMSAEQCRASFGLDSGTRTLLVTGGSLGSRSINESLALLARERADLFAGWQVLHQSGDEASAARLREAYSGAGIRAEVRAFISDMGSAWGASDVAICRAGAGTVGEAWVSGTPAVFMPYPYHRDDHQTANARPLERAGAAVIVTDRIDATANRDALGDVLQGVLGDDAAPARMRAGLEALGPAAGAERVAQRAISAH